MELLIERDYSKEEEGTSFVDGFLNHSNQDQMRLDFIKKMRKMKEERIIK